MMMPGRIIRDNRCIPLVVTGLLVVLAGQVVFGMRASSPTADEYSHHIASGYSYLLTGDFRMNPASPPLPRLASAIPLYFLKARLPLDHPSWQSGDSPQFARQFFSVANRGTDRLVFWARVPTIFLSLGFGLLVFWWTRKVFGAAAGVLALAFYAFCPDILAHAGLATADIAVALFFFMTIVAFWRYLKKPVPKNLVWAGVAAGFTFLSKFSAVALLPVLLLIALSAGKAREVRPARTGLFLIVAFFTIWAGYFFEIKPLLKNTPDPSKKAAMYEKIGGPALLRFAETAPVPLSTFSSAFVSMMVTRARGTNAFLLGQWSGKGWWYYYFLAFCVKKTIPFLLMICIAFVLFRKFKTDRVTAAVLWVPILFFFVATMKDRAQAGIRYFLPAYPLFFALAGGVGAYLWKKKGIFRAFVAGMILWHAAEAALIAPHYLAYFNESIGGPKNGYKVLRDSNLDWGQGLKGLAKYVKDKDCGKIALGYPWPVDPAEYGILYRACGSSDYATPAPEVYAISVHVLDSFVWAKNRKPDAMIGYSIFIYDMRNKSSGL